MRLRHLWVFAALGVVLLALPAAAQSQRITVVRDIDYVPGAEYPGGKDRLDLYIPEGTANAPVILSIHGGALSAGDRSEESFVGRRLAAEGYLTVVISYRLSPQVSHPAHIEDAAAAFAWRSSTPCGRGKGASAGGRSTATTASSSSSTTTWPAWAA